MNYWHKQGHLNHNIIMLSERSQTWKYIYCKMSFISNAKNGKLTQVGLVVVWGWKGSSGWSRLWRVIGSFGVGASEICSLSSLCRWFTVADTCQNFKTVLIIYKIVQNFKIVHSNMCNWVHVNYISNYVFAC